MKSIEDIKQIRENMKNIMSVRKNNLLNTNEKHILVCAGTGCTSSKSLTLIENLKNEIKNRNIENIKVVKTGCFGLCAKGPIVVIHPDNIFYSRVMPEDAVDIVNGLVEGQIVQKLLCTDIDDKVVEKISDLTFYKLQQRVALRNCGNIDPENIDEYIGNNGYVALEKALFSMTPNEIIDEIKKSGLRGRGGAGFSTGMKWEFAKNSVGDIKYVLCNADEGDPGAFMDRSILEGDPHAVLEAMMIAGYAIGANQGYIYVRAEYPIAVKRLQIAINQAREYGILGKRIWGTNFNFDIDIRLGAGAFVCGEETALMRSIEGLRGEPRPRPPFPAVKGLFDKPTLLNNVETYANIAQIIINGSEWYRGIGTETSKGTKVFALGGNINNVGLVEVPMGVTLRQIIYDIGGGVANGREFKAAQTGGPSGGCIPKECLDVPIDYDSLSAIGSMMGSGGLIVMDDTKCMVNIAKFFMEFIVDESCGKCPPCRIGTKRMLEILTKITQGKGEEGDIEKLEKLAENIKKSSLCGLGQTAPNSVLSTLRYFRDEYEAHIKEKRCPAGECKSMTKVVIDKEKCKGCSLCAKNCPVGAIHGELKSPFEVDTEKCIKCGLCIEKCPFKAISRK